jgi:hypothetical protein
MPNNRQDRSMCTAIADSLRIALFVCMVACFAFAEEPLRVVPADES